MEPRDLEAIKRAVEAARFMLAVDDTQFLPIKHAEIGSPSLIYTPAGDPAFWIVPLLVENTACGFARVDISGKVAQIGTFGSGPEDCTSWIDAAFFENPLPEMLSAIRTQHPELEVSEPILSYDASPIKWAWRVEMRKGGEIRSVVFITPHGWYKRYPNTGKPDLEG